MENQEKSLRNKYIPNIKYNHETQIKIKSTRNLTNLSRDNRANKNAELKKAALEHEENGAKLVIKTGKKLEKNQNTNKKLPRSKITRFLCKLPRVSQPSISRK